MTGCRIGKVKYKGSNIVSFPTNKSIETDAVALCREILDMARSGKLAHILVVAVSDDGHPFTQISKNFEGSIYPFFAGLDLMRKTLLDCFVVEETK